MGHYNITLLHEMREAMLINSIMPFLSFRSFSLRCYLEEQRTESTMADDIWKGNRERKMISFID